MAAKKTKAAQDDTAPAAPAEGVTLADPLASLPPDALATAIAEGDRAATVTQVACALLQSPRFASRITDEAQQDWLVKCAVQIADKIIAATSTPDEAAEPSTPAA